MSRKRGAVLLPVLWLCMIVVWIALEVAASTGARTSRIATVLMREKASFIALGGLFEACARLKGEAEMRGDDTASSLCWLPDNKVHRVEYRTGSASVRIEEEGIKYPINEADAGEIEIVLREAGYGERSVALAQCIADFVDDDTDPRPFGAEAEDYEQAGLFVRPADEPLQSLEQLRMVMGVAAAEYFGSRDTSVHSGAGPVSLRDLFTVYERAESASMPSAYRPGELYRITSEGRGGGRGPIVRLQAIVRYLPDLKVGYEVVYRDGI